MANNISNSQIQKTKSGFIFDKIKKAIKEKRFFKSCLYFVLKLFLSKQKSFQAMFLCDYFFGRKDVQYTVNCINEINKKPKQKKIKVVFICWMTEMWSSLRTVYEELQKNPGFDVYILAQPHTTDIKYMKDQNPAYEFLSGLYGKKRVINAFEKKSWFDLKAFNPDYVFYSYPYEIYYYEGYMSCEVRKFAKVCLIQYAYNFETDATFCASHNFTFLKNVSIHFVADNTIKHALEKVLKNKKSNYPKIINFGYPRFDLLESIKKIKGKKTVLWTPRWTSPDRKLNKQSHFLSYYKKLLEFASMHSDINFIIRPHPLMFGNFLQKGVMTETEINDFKTQCKKMKNVELDESADYIPSISKASVIISDFTGLLAEYFIIGKPIIYCDGNRGFSREALILDSSLYHEDSWEKIEERLNKLLSGKDDMEKFRKEALKQFLPNGKGQTSKKIVDFLKDDYYGKGF